MKHKNKTKGQIICEMAELQQRLIELELDEGFFRNQEQGEGFDETAYNKAMGMAHIHGIEAADQVIRGQEERLRLVLEASSDGFWDWSLERDEIYLSHRLAQILGYSMENIQIKTHQWKAQIHPDDIPARMKMLIQHMQGLTPIYISEYRLLTKAGEWKWLSDRGKVVARDEQNKPLRMVGSCYDITNRKQNEIAVLKSRAQVQTIIDNIPFYAWLCDSKGKFVAVNNTYCRGCGLTPDDIIGKTVFDIFPREEAEIYWAEDNEVIKTQQKMIGEDLIKSQSEGIWVEKYKIPVFDNNRNIIGMVGLLRDITEQKKFQKEVERLDRLHLVGEMAACIGHEIRNPITSVRGFLQMFANKYFEDKYSEDTELLDLMIQELDRANLIITEFLSLANNKLVELQPRKLNIVLKNISPLIKAIAAMQDKEINFKMEQTPHLLIDEKEIRQLTLNLVNNALESMPSGGIVTIGTLVEEADVVLSIQDQGRGINPEILDKLGNPFITTKADGTGLGLAICYGIAARHNAKIEIETASTGTTFLVRFPIPNIGPEAKQGN